MTDVDTKEQLCDCRNGSCTASAPIPSEPVSGDTSPAPSPSVHFHKGGGQHNLYWAHIEQAGDEQPWTIVTILSGVCRGVDGKIWPDCSFRELVWIPSPLDCKRGRAALDVAEGVAKRLTSLLHPDYTGGGY